MDVLILPTFHQAKSIGTLSERPLSLLFHKPIYAGAFGVLPYQGLVVHRTGFAMQFQILLRGAYPKALAASAALAFLLCPFMRVKLAIPPK